jgi:hypothetical protein
MGKDREGKFHPPKGKPSGTLREGSELKEMMGSDLRVRHPNRQTHKGKDEVYKTTEEGSDRTWKEKVYVENASIITPQEIYGVLTKEKLKELAEFKSDCCITVVLPMYRAGMEVNEHHNLRLYKNVVQGLRLQLRDKERVLAPAIELMRDDLFWKNQGDGIALFMSEGYFWYCKLPFKPGQEVIVNNAFYLINLLRLLNTNSIDEFYLLLLRRGMVRLYKADARLMHEMEVPELPRDITDVIDFAEAEEKENEETEPRIQAGRPDKLIVASYVEKISAAFEPESKDDRWPLLLAGDKELMDAFRRVSKYDSIFPTDLPMDDEHADSRKIFQQAREKMEKTWNQYVSERLKTYYDSIATPLTKSMPESVIPAAYYGQVRYLFVEKGAHAWGRFDAESNQLILHADREDNDDCLLEKAAVQTVLHGGEVFVLEKNKMPNGATIAALTRY